MSNDEGLTTNAQSIQNYEMKSTNLFSNSHCGNEMDDDIEFFYYAVNVVNPCM